MQPSPSYGASAAWWARPQQDWRCNWSDIRGCHRHLAYYALYWRCCWLRRDGGPDRGWIAPDRLSPDRTLSSALGGRETVSLHPVALRWPAQKYGSADRNRTIAEELRRK